MMNFETGNLLILVGCISIIFLVTGPQVGVTGFEFGAYCRKLCAWGKGGNLCKCSAVHFAGKRGETDVSFPNIEQEVLGGSDSFYNDQFPVDTQPEDVDTQKISLEDIKQIYNQLKVASRLAGREKNNQMLLDTLETIIKPTKHEV